MAVPEEGVLRNLAEKVRAFVTVELSMGQMIEDVELATRCMRPVLLCNRTGGMVMTPEEVYKKIIKPTVSEVPNNGRFEKPEVLTDAVMHYCPGCTHGIVHRSC